VGSLFCDFVGLDPLHLDMADCLVHSSGSGNIGSKVAAYAKAFGMLVLVSTRNPEFPAKTFRNGVESVGNNIADLLVRFRALSATRARARTRSLARLTLVLNLLAVTMVFPFRLQRQSTTTRSIPCRWLREWISAVVAGMGFRDQERLKISAISRVLCPPIQPHLRYGSSRRPHTTQ
jgi:hypothetical protein